MLHRTFSLVFVVAVCNAARLPDAGVSTKIDFDDDFDTPTVVRTFHSPQNDHPSASILLKKLSDNDTVKFEIDGTLTISTNSDSKDSKKTNIPIKDIPILTTPDVQNTIQQIPPASFHRRNQWQPSISPQLPQDYLTAVNNFNTKQQWLYQQQKPKDTQQFHISMVLLPPLVATGQFFEEKPQKVIPIYHQNPNVQVVPVSRRCDGCRRQLGASPFKNPGVGKPQKAVQVDDKLEDLD